MKGSLWGKLNIIDAFLQLSPQLLPELQNKLLTIALSQPTIHPSFWSELLIKGTYNFCTCYYWGKTTVRLMWPGSLRVHPQTWLRVKIPTTKNNPNQSHTCGHYYKGVKIVRKLTINNFIIKNLVILFFLGNLACALVKEAENQVRLRPSLPADF